MDDMKNIRRDPPQFQRTLTRPPSFRYKSATSVDAPPASPSRLATQDSPLRENVLASPPVEEMDCGDGFPSQEAKRPTEAPFELLDSGDEDSTPPRPLNQDLRVDLTPTQSMPTVMPEASLTPETPSSTSEPPFEPQSTPDLGPESDVAKHFIPPVDQRPRRLALLAWLILPLVLFWCLFLVLMEWDWAPLAEMRRLPELVLLRRQYYEPAKEALGSWVGTLLGTP